MTTPSSFSTICTFPCVQELVGLILSLNIHHPNTTLYIISDTPTKNYILQTLTPHPTLNIKFKTTLDYATKLNRIQMEKMGSWTKFQMEKANSMTWALTEKNDVMFLDSDQLVVSSINTIDKNKPLGVSPHFMPTHITDKYGYYNGGMLWTSNKQVPIKWIEFSKTSRYYDQACIEELAKQFPHFIFGNDYNIQSYRFTQGLMPIAKYMGCFKVSPGSVKFLDKEVKTFHTHFRKGDPMTRINQFIQGLLIKAKKWKEVSIIDRMIHEKWLLYIPKQPTPHPHFHHSNDSYRMLPNIWKTQNKDVEVSQHPQRLNCWLGNSVMLYDRPTLQWINDEAKAASLVMMGNGGKNELSQIQNATKTPTKPWIFWPRDIHTYLTNRTKLPWDKRPINSIFIGNFENSVQQRHR